MQWGIRKNLWPKQFPECPVARHFVCKGTCSWAAIAKPFVYSYVPSSPAGRFFAGREKFTRPLMAPNGMLTGSAGHWHSETRTSDANKKLR